MARLFGFCYPGYRYCGPGCSGPGAPTNPVDACCKYHDECYRYCGDKNIVMNYSSAVYIHISTPIAKWGEMLEFSPERFI